MVPFSAEALIVNVHKAPPRTELEKKENPSFLIKELVFHGWVWALSREVKRARRILLTLKQ